MDVLHSASDTQSLLLNEAAVSILIDHPELVSTVLATLDHWDRVAPPDSKALRDEWREILRLRQFDRVLADTARGQQLRQASPMGRVLPPQRRLEIIRACKGRSSNI